MSTKEQLQAAKDRLAQLDPNNRNDIMEIGSVKSQIAELTKQAALEEEQTAAANQRIQEATEQAAYFLDNLVVEDLTMRELCGDENKYQMLRIVVQNKIISLAEENSRMLSESQAEDATQRNELKQQIEILQNKVDENSREAFENHETIRQLRTDLAQSQLERNDFESKLKNATNEIDRLNSQVDDLRKEIAVGARNAYKVTDVEQQAQMKELAEKIKATKVKVTNMEFTDYTHVNYTAILLQDLPSENKKFGDRIEFPSIFKSKYIEIKDAAEVERFRAEHQSNQEAVSDSALGNEETANVTQEATFPTVPTAQAPVVQGEVPVATGPSSGGVQAQTVEERLAALEKRVVELEKVCDINEEAA